MNFLEIRSESQFSPPFSLEDITKVVVEPWCWDSLCGLPCQHDVQITLKDGRVGFLTNGRSTLWLVTRVAKEIINPNGEMYFQEETKEGIDYYDRLYGEPTPDFLADGVIKHFTEKCQNLQEPSAEEVSNSIAWEPSAASELS